MQFGYFSLDLDFWAADKLPVDAAFVDKLVATFAGSDRCVAAFDHHSILPHVSRYWDTCNVLINQDWHSDLAGYNFNCVDSHYSQKPDLNCGTWADYVWWKNMDMFVWSYPTPECANFPYGEGRCDAIGYNAFDTGHTDWKLATKVHSTCARGYHLQFHHGNVTYSPVASVCIPIIAMSFVWSKEWAEDDAESVFKRLIKKYKVHVIDGVRGKMLRRCPDVLPRRRKM